MKDWSVEIDIIKVIAIIIIVFGHIDNYLSDPSSIRTAGSYLVLIGLSFFFFASGYTLPMHNQRFEKVSDFLSFYKKRCIRIFPLYLIALATIILIFGFLNISAGNATPYNLSLLNVGVHIFALQALLPVFSMQAMWFVSMIFIFYIIYPFVVLSTKKTKSLLICLLTIFFAFAALRFFFGLIDIRFFEYFPVFIFGVIASKNHLFSDTKFNRFIILSSFPLIITGLLLFTGYRFVFNNPFGQYIIIPVFLIFITIFGYYVAKLCVPHLKKSGESIISKMAYSSYAIYLFHLPLLALLLAILTCIFNNPVTTDLLIIIFGIPSTIIAGYFIQCYSDKVLRILFSNRSSKINS